MLDPTSLWKMLLKLFLSDRNYSALTVKEDRPGAGRALIESKYILHGEILDASVLVKLSCEPNTMKQKVEAVFIDNHMLTLSAFRRLI